MKIGQLLVFKLKYWTHRGHIVYRTDLGTGDLFKLAVPTRPCTDKLEEPINKSNETRTEVYYTPVQKLNSFLKEWVIKVRLTQKQPIRQTAKGLALLKLVFMDANSTEIEAPCFGPAGEKFDSFLK